jgi:hypothetical protein
VLRSDATNPNAYHDAIARLGGAATIAAQRVGSALPEVSETIGNVATKAVTAAAPVVARGSGVVSAAVVVLTPANASQYGHEQQPGETEQHWLERTDPKAAAYVAHQPESRVHVTPVDDMPKSAIASRTPAQSDAALPNHTGHSTAIPAFPDHTGHTTAPPPVDPVSTTPITLTNAADHALFAKASTQSKTAVDGKPTELETLSNAKAGKAAKTLTTTIVDATKQANRVVIDARDQRGLTEASARDAARNAVKCFQDLKSRTFRSWAGKGTEPTILRR